MSIELPAELAEAAEFVATTKGYETVADYLADVVRQDAAAYRDGKPKNFQQTEEWRNRFFQWANSHANTKHPVDTDRDSIYGVRGL